MAEFWRSSTVASLEARRSAQENSCYRQHLHDSLSIGVIDAGVSHFSGPMGGAVSLEPGDVVIIPAGQVHACNPEEAGWLYRMIHLDQEWAASLMSPQTAATLLDAVSVLRDPALAEAATALTDELFLDPSKEQIEEAFYRFFATAGDAPTAHRVRASVDPQLRARIEPVLRRLSEDEVTPRLDALGALVGMSSYQVVRAVKRVTGLSPIAWRQNARVLRARRLLGEGESIADAANLLGFTDQSHFHRVFRAHVAASPGAYQA